MNNRIALIAILLLSQISQLAYADEYQKVYAQQMTQVALLPQLTQQYFAGAKGENFEDALTLHDMLDDKRHQLRVKIRTALSNAIDSNSDINALSAYGLSKVKENTYQIEYKKTPQWARIADVFMYLRDTKGLQSAERELKTMGLSSNDLSILNDYLVKNNIQVQLYKNALNVSQTGKLELANKTNNNAKAAYAQLLSQNMKNGDHKVWHHWLKQLMGNFSQVKQQIIFEYGKQQLGKRISQFSSTAISQQKSLDFATRIESGKFEQWANNAIARIHEQQEFTQELK